MRHEVHHRAGLVVLDAAIPDTALQPAHEGQRDLARLGIAGQRGHLDEGHNRPRPAATLVRSPGFDLGGIVVVQQIVASCRSRWRLRRTRLGRLSGSGIVPGGMRRLGRRNLDRLSAPTCPALGGACGR